MHTAGASDRTEIQLPSDLVEHLRTLGRPVDAVAAEAIRLGVDPASRPPEPTGPASDPDPVRRHRQAVESLLHYAGRYWYLSLIVPRLVAEVDQLKEQLAEVERSNAG